VRVQALVRDLAEEPGVIEYGELRIDTAAHEVTIGATPVALRRLEYALLGYIARDPVRLGASKRKRRVDRPDFEIIADEQYERLRRAACESRADDYGLILEGATLGVGDAAMRPGGIRIASPR
jgi:hypothetical protein